MSHFRCLSRTTRKLTRKVRFPDYCNQKSVHSPVLKVYTLTDNKSDIELIDLTSNNTDSVPGFV